MKLSSLTDIDNFIEIYFVKEAPKHLKKEELSLIQQNGTFVCLGPFVDNEGNRKILSREQLNILISKGYIEKNKFSFKKQNNVVLYIRTFENRITLNENDEIECIDLFIAIFLKDTKEIIPKWCNWLFEKEDV